MKKIRRNTVLNISEHFFSVQGEGITAGKPAYFVRLQGCNLLCGNPTGHLIDMTQTEIERAATAKWCCDTISVWLKGEKTSSGELLQQITGKGLEKWLLEDGTASFVFTGGEPTMKRNADGIASFLDYCHEFQWAAGKPFSPYVEIETNATVVTESGFYESYITQINASPKLENSGMPFKKRFNREALQQIAKHKNSWFKFVVSTPSDMQEIERDFLQIVPRSKVILMPALSSQAGFHTAQRFVYEMAKQHGVRAMNRNHISAWNKKTGV